jgi:hypothetical protein
MMMMMMMKERSDEDLEVEMMKTERSKKVVKK